jgi:hypothetical protein
MTASEHGTALRARQISRSCARPALFLTPRSSARDFRRIEYLQYLAFAVAGQAHEALSDFEGFLFRLHVDQREAIDEWQPCARGVGGAFAVAA